MLLRTRKSIVDQLVYSTVKYNSVLQFFSLSSYSALFSLLYSDPNTISSLSSFSLPSLLGPLFGSLVVVRGWVVGPVFGSWVTTWVNSGCGFWRGSLWWLSFFFFFFLGYDRCLKGLWVVVGSGVWVVVVGLWLRWVVAEVGHWSWIGGWSGSLVVGCGWGDSGDDFFWMGLLRWVSNRLGFKSATWVSDRWLCWFDGLMAWVSDRRGFDGLCLFMFVFVVCAKGWGRLRKKKRLESLGKWNHA